MWHRFGRLTLLSSIHVGWEIIKGLLLGGVNQKAFNIPPASIIIISYKLEIRFRKLKHYNFCPPIDP